MLFPPFLLMAAQMAGAPLTADTGPREPWRQGNATSLWYLCGDWRSKERECTSYIDGVAEALSADAEARGSAPRFCPPRLTSYAQKRAVVVRFLQAHPELRHYTKVRTVAEALAAAFPCPPARGR